MARGSQVGVDIATTAVRAAEVKVTDGIPRLEHIGQIGLPEGAVRLGEVVHPEVVGAALRELWGTVKFSTKSVVLGISNPRVVVRRKQLPWIPPGDVRKSLPLVLDAEDLPLDPESAVMDLVPLSEEVVEGRRMLTGMVTAAAEEMLMGFVAAARAGGLRPKAIDLSGFGLLRSVGSWDPLGIVGESEAIVDIGAGTTSVIVHRGGRPQFVRLLGKGGNDISAALAGELQVSTLQAEEIKRETPVVPIETLRGDSRGPLEIISEVIHELVDEIRSSLEYHAATDHTGPVARIILSGGVARTRGLATLLQRNAGIDVYYAVPLERMDTEAAQLLPEQRLYLEPMAGICVGLAMAEDS